MPKPKDTLGSRIDKLQDLYVKIKDLEGKASALKQLYDFEEKEILDFMEKQGMTKASGTKATVSVSKNEVPSVEDWDSFYTFIRRNNAFYLLQRRANAAPYRELLAQRRNKKIPGVSTVEKTTLNRRVIPS